MKVLWEACIGYVMLNLAYVVTEHDGRGCAPLFVGVGLMIFLTPFVIGDEWNKRNRRA